MGGVMFNKYFLWKYLLILVVFVVGFIYFVFNFYLDDLVVQISGVSMVLQVIQVDVDCVVKVLIDVGIVVKVDSLLKKGGLICLVKQDDQFFVKEVVCWILGDDYVVVLNLVQIIFEWLCKLGGSLMKFGLDLFGGVYFLLEVDMDKVVDVCLKVYESEVKSLLCKECVCYCSLLIQDCVIQFGFIDSEFLDKVCSLIVKDFCDFEVVFEECNGLQVLCVVLIQVKLVEICEYFIKQNFIIVCNWVNELGVFELLVQCQGVNCIVVELLGVQDIVEVKWIFGKIVNLEFCLVVELDVLKFVIEIFEFCELCWLLVLLECGVIIIGDQVIDVSVSFDENGCLQVNICLDGYGGELMNCVICNNVGCSMVVVFIEQKLVICYIKQMVDGVEKEVVVLVFKEEKQIISLVIIQLLLGNQFCIIGFDGLGEFFELVLLLCVGGLVVLMYFVEECIIGLSLGVDNIVKGIDVLFWGMFFVLLFIIVIYCFFGVIVIVVLVFNMVMLVVLMLIFGVILILLGIVGIVLIMGMVVDVNVLIFLWICEELVNGMLVQRVIYEGFNCVFIVIFDVNLILLLVGGIFYVMGIGLVKGFVVIMLFGIIISMFMVIMVICVMVNLIFGGCDFKKLWI